MRILVLLLLSISSYQSYAQDGRIHYKAKCGLNNYPLDEAEELARYTGNLTKYFSKNINWKKLEQIGGLIIIDVAVDTIGRTCATGYINRTMNSDNEVLNLWLHQIVNNMPGWAPARRNGAPVNTTVQLALYSAVEGHKDLEVTYFRGFAVQNEKIRIIPRNASTVPADWDELNHQRK